MISNIKIVNINIFIAKVHTGTFYCLSLNDIVLAFVSQVQVIILTKICCFFFRREDGIARI